MVFDGGKLTFLLCMVLGLLGPRGQGEVCSHGIPDCRGRQWCPKVGPSQLGSSAMGVPEIRAEIHWDILQSVQSLHTPCSCAALRLLPDRSSSARCCPVSSPDGLGHLCRRGSRK